MDAIPVPTTMARCGASARPQGDCGPLGAATDAWPRARCRPSPGAAPGGVTCRHVRPRGRQVGVGRLGRRPGRTCGSVRATESTMATERCTMMAVDGSRKQPQPLCGEDPAAAAAHRHGREHGARRRPKRSRWRRPAHGRDGPWRPPSRRRRPYSGGTHLFGRWRQTGTPLRCPSQAPAAPRTAAGACTGGSAPPTISGRARRTDGLSGP